MRKWFVFFSLLAGLLMMNVSGAEPMLGGATLIFPQGVKDGLNCIGILVTKSRKVIVFDGGSAKDLDPLLEHLKPYGNTVHHWFISHAHNDHIGALLELCDRKNVDFKVEKVYYNFPDQKFLNSNETWSVKEVSSIFDRLPKIPFPVVKPVQDMSVKVDDIVIDVLNSPFYIKGGNAVNESSVVYRVTAGGKKILFTGDIGEKASAELLKLCPEKLKADIVVMAHHGQNGATREFYAAVAPQIAVWPTATWIWENNDGGGFGSATLMTNYVKVWMQELGIRKNFVTGFGDVVIQ